MYSKLEIIKIFKECKSIDEIMKVTYLFKFLFLEGLLYDKRFIQEIALIQINYITDDGN